MANTRILLGAIGEEDNYLTKDAKNTLFKTSYKTHSNFTSNWNVIKNNKGGDSSRFGAGGKIYFRLPFEGDLLLNTYLRVLLIEKTNKTPDTEVSFLALNLIENLEFIYKDKVLNSFDRNYLANYFKLNLNRVQYTKYRKMSSIDELTIKNYDTFLSTADSAGMNVYEVLLPLPFWFTKSSSQAFPFWALKDADIGINITLSNSTSYLNGLKGNNAFPILETGLVKDVQILAKYGYLDNSEKQKFNNKSLEYLIEQNEIVDTSVVDGNFNKKINIPSKHFVTHLIWNLTPNSSNLGRVHVADRIIYCFDSVEGINKTSISFNGNFIIADADSNFTTMITRYNYFKFPENNIKNSSEVFCYGNVDETIDRNLHVYSFAIKPDDFGSTGFLTTEKFNKGIIEITGSTPTYANIDNYRLNVYQVYKNIIRIENGELNILFN